MKVITRASFGVLAAIFSSWPLLFPAAMANPVSSAPAAAPSPTSDGTTIDQGIAYVLMLVALVLTYLIH